MGDSPFIVNAADVDVSLQETIIEMQSDEVLLAKFKNRNHDIWKTNDTAEKYPLLWQKAQLYVIAFPSSYLVESGFSHVSRVANRPGMPGTVPELTSGVPCPGPGHVCPGIY